METDPGVQRCDGDSYRVLQSAGKAKDIYEKSGKTKFAEEIISASVNEIDRIMRENGGD